MILYTNLYQFTKGKKHKRKTCVFSFIGSRSDGERMKNNQYCQFIRWKSDGSRTNAEYKKERKKQKYCSFRSFGRKPKLIILYILQIILIVPGLNLFQNVFFQFVRFQLNLFVHFQK